MIGNSKIIAYDEVKVLKKSLMPENIPDLLTVRQLHDLFAYLMTLE